MAMKNPFDQVVRVLHKEELKKFDGEIVKFPQKFFNKTFIGVRPSNLLNAKAYGAVTEYCFPLKQNAREFHLFINIHYELSCPPGNEHQVAHALFDENTSPKVTFEHRLKNFLKDHPFKDDSMALENMSAKLNGWRDKLLYNILKTLGLSAHLRFETLHQPKRSQAITLTKETIRLQGYAPPLEVDVEAIIELVDPLRASIHEFRKTEKLKRIVQEHLKGAFTKISLLSFCKDLKHQVTASVETVINTYLEFMGYRLERLTLNAEVSNLLQNIPVKIPTFQVQLKNFASPINIDAHVDFQVQIDHKTTSIEQDSGQLQRMVESIIREVLEETDLNTFLYDLNPAIRNQLKFRIEKETKPRGRVIGNFDVKSQDIDGILDMLKSIILELPDLDVQLEDYPVPFKVSLTIEFVSYLSDSSRVSVCNQFHLRQIVEEVLRKEFRTITLHTFLNNLNHKVREQIKAAIEKITKPQGRVIGNFTVKSPEIRRIKELRLKEQNFEIEIETSHKGEYGRVDFSARYRVLSVSKNSEELRRFLDTLPDAEELTDTVKTSLKQLYSDKPFNSYVRELSNDELLVKTDLKLCKNVLAAHGVEIKLIRWQKNISEREREANMLMDNLQRSPVSVSGMFKTRGAGQYQETPYKATLQVQGPTDWSKIHDRMPTREILTKYFDELFNLELEGLTIEKKISSLSKEHLQRIENLIQTGIKQDYGITTKVQNIYIWEH